MSGASPSSPPADDFARLQAWVDADRAGLLTFGDKAVPPEWVGRQLSSFADEPGDSAALPTPCLTLSRAALQTNLDEFANWARSHGVAHAPHGKTSMAPALWLAQLRAGAWAITVANETQARVALACGVPRVLVANLLLRPGALRWLAEQTAQPGSPEVICWVDSVEAVAVMDAALAESPGRVNVLVELGSVRTGARTAEQAVAVAQAVSASEHLELVGVGGYEGVAVQGTSDEDEATVRAFLGTLAAVAGRIRSLVAREQMVLSAGGSTWFDLVVDVFGANTPDRLVVVRSGSVVSHDDGTYLHSTPAARGRSGPALAPALHLWARVLARPEPGRVIVDAGKRDLPFDSGLPIPQLVVTQDGLVPLTGHEVVGTNDQHATLAVPDDSPLRVGSVVRSGISHPCTAFDKWGLIPVLDDADRIDAQVVDWVRTWF